MRMVIETRGEDTLADICEADGCAGYNQSSIGMQNWCCDRMVRSYVTNACGDVLENARSSLYARCIE